MSDPTDEIIEALQRELAELRQEFIDLGVFQEEDLLSFHSEEDEDPQQLFQMVAAEYPTAYSNFLDLVQLGLAPDLTAKWWHFFTWFQGELAEVKAKIKSDHSMLPIQILRLTWELSTFWDFYFNSKLI